jgi:FtsP/CotA-like multicopper oxidase with cupredoxin domain
MPSNRRVASRSVLLRTIAAAALAALASTAAAQIAVNPLPAGAVPSGVFNAFPAQNVNGPTGKAFQTNYPYPGQCVADPVNAALFPTLGPCPATGSFAGAQRTASSWAEAGAVVTPFKTLNPILPATQTKFAWPVLNPPDYTPDTTTYPNADYYEIGLHEAWGFDAIAKAGLFPNPGAAVKVPNGMQWTGLTCNIAAGCACPADASATFKAAFCTAGGRIPSGGPLFTPIWGVGQINNQGGPVTGALRDVLGTCSVSGALCNVNPATPFPGAVTCPAAEVCTPFFAAGAASGWSANNYVATWPSISIRATRNRPVVVKWTNEFPNTHVLCPHPEAADWPCAIDRTFMGVKATVDPALPRAVPANKVNPFGSPQQPDNSWVTHLHGGEIPPATDGFAEKWFGSKVTAPAYANMAVSPPFENPSDLVLQRPAGFSDTYTYPIVQEEALIWFHDHTLGKTHHNVIAGPAGFFPVVDPAMHGGTGTGTGTCPAGQATCAPTYTWLDPVTQPRSVLNVPLYDLFLAVQDRSFNEDGSLNFSNGLGQVIPPAPFVAPVGYTSVTPGVNPRVHPTWIPEYFGDHALVNGVLWPRFTATNGWYRVRVVDGSDSRCYTVGLSNLLPAPGTAPTNNVPFWVVANDQGYLPTPARVSTFTMCPGERYELLVNFSAVAPGSSIYMTNNAPAPFPAGITPMAAASPYADMNVIMRFDVVAGTPAAPAVKTCARGAINNWDATWVTSTTGQAAMLAAINAGTACMPATPANDPTFARITPPVLTSQTNITFPAGAIVRQVYLNEHIDGVTLAPLGMQLNGVPFEYKVTETPRKGTREFWQFVNLTVDAHPMHPHLVKHQIVARQPFSVGKYKAALCGSTTCQPNTAPGGEMHVVPDVTPFLTGTLILVPAYEAGWKDATKAPPGQVTTIVADWAPRWNAAGAPNAPGTAGCPSGTVGCAAPYVFEDVTTGPYVWHCHINSHEDSEMMRTSLVVP